MAGPVATAALIGGGTYAMESLPTYLEQRASRKFDEKYGTDDYLEAQSKVLKEKAEGFKPEVRRKMLAEAVRGIQAAAKGARKGLRREAAATGGFGRSGLVGEQQTALVKELAEGATQSQAAIDAASQAHLEGEQGRIAGDQAQALALIETRRLEELGRTQKKAEALQKGVSATLGSGGASIAAAPANVSSGLNLGRKG